MDTGLIFASVYAGRAVWADFHILFTPLTNTGIVARSDLSLHCEPLAIRFPQISPRDTVALRQLCNACESHYSFSCMGKLLSFWL